MQLGKSYNCAYFNHHRCVSNDNTSSCIDIMKQGLSTTFQQKTKRRRRRIGLHTYTNSFIIYSQIIITIISLLNYKFLSPTSSFVTKISNNKNHHHSFVTSNSNTMDTMSLTTEEEIKKSYVIMEATKKNKGLVVYKNKKKNISSTSTATTNAVVKVALKSKQAKNGNSKKRYMDDKSMERILNGDDEDEEDRFATPTIPKTTPATTTTTTTTTTKKKRLTSPFSKTMKHFTTLASSSNTDRVLHANVKETGKDTMSQYFKSIGNHELLRHEDEIVLGRQIQKLVKWEKTRNELEDELLREPTVEEWANALNKTTASLQKQIKRSQRAKTALIEANLRLVITIARQNLKGAHTTKTINFQDACQDGIIGLIKACEKYDPAQGFRFSTYAHWWIKRQIRENLMQQSSNNKRAYNLPYHVLRKINHMKIMEVTLREKNKGKKPSDQRLAKELEITVDKLNYYRKLSQEAISLDKQLSIKQGKGSRASGPTSTSSTIYDVTPDQENMTPIEDTDKQMLQHDVRRLINTLSPREQAVIRLRFGLMTDDSTPQTLENIAKRFRVSTDKVRAIETSALKKLKQPYRNSSLKCYVSDYL